MGPVQVGPQSLGLGSRSNAAWYWHTLCSPVGGMAAHAYKDLPARSSA